MDLSKEAVEEEIVAIKESIVAHEQQKDLHEKMLMSENLILSLMEKHLESMVRMSRNRKI